MIQENDPVILIHGCSVHWSPVAPSLLLPRKDWLQKIDAN